MALGTLAAILLLLARAQGLAALILEGVRNFRKIEAPLPIYRSANLDNATAGDVATLLSGIDGQSVSKLIELRNTEELKPMSKASVELYDSLGDKAMRQPIIEDVDAFWAAIERDSPKGLLIGARTATIWNGRALDVALARRLENQRLPGLYRGILASAPLRIGHVLRQVLHTVEAGDAVIFNCQKGKDRTGLIAALLERVLEVDLDTTLDAYSESGRLLGEADDAPAYGQRKSDEEVDWSLFRGSPRDAMEITLTWLDAEYGGFDRYLNDVADFTYADQRRLKDLAASS